jgi:hypothetical protein
MTYQSSPLHPEDSRTAVSLPCTPNFAGEGDEPPVICSHTGSVPAPFFYSPAENRPRILNYITANNSITENRAYFYSTGFGSCAAGFSPGVTGYVIPRVLGFSLRVMGFSLRIMDHGFWLSCSRCLTDFTSYTPDFTHTPQTISPYHPVVAGVQIL